MKKFLSILFIFIFYSPPSHSLTLPTNKVEFCERFNDHELLINYSQEPQNLMAFKNQGGLLDGGVCWWHSRFQRNILYLSLFKPELPRPTLSEAKNIIKEIRLGRNIVKIPGFFNFFEFSKNYKKEIISELEKWQIYEGVVLGSWIDGLKGDIQIDPSRLKKMMDSLYTYVEVEKKIAYQKLQIRGITSHSWLVVGLKKTIHGYDIGFIDSNSPSMTEIYSYHFGDNSFFDKYYGSFVPYLEFTREEKRLQEIAKSFCDDNTFLNASQTNWDFEEKLDLVEAVNNLNSL